jgi:prepilin-type processing-associated H-X9-DG protein
MAMQPQTKSMQFGLRTIFVLTALVAVMVCAVRFGNVYVVLIGLAVVTTVGLFWGVRLRRDDVAKLCAVTLLLSGLLLFLLPAMQPTRTITSRSECQNNLKQVGLALQNYHDKYGRFPPAVVYDANGKPMHSWRTLILPEIEEGPLFQQYRMDEPWDSPHNKKVTQAQIQCFQCPDDKNVGKFDTSYVALIGPDSVWSGEDGAKGSEVTDGTAQTMVVIEMKNSGIHWAEPRDLDLDALPTKFNKRKLGEMLSPHKHGVITVYADGHVEVIPFDATVEDLKAAVSKSQGDMADFEKQYNRVVPSPSNAKP